MKKFLAGFCLLFVSLTDAWARGYRPMSRPPRSPAWIEAMEPYIGLITGLMVMGALVVFLLVFAKAKENDARRAC